LLALTSEAYFKFCDKDWKHDGQEEKAYDKGVALLEHGCMFSEFGTRRRRDYKTHDMVMQGLTRAANTAKEKKWKGKLTGTSNVHFAIKYGIPPVGTVAHEWFMGIASVTNDYEHANETALRYWVGCFGEGVLGIALTDTFGTATFLKAFKKSLPTAAEAEMNTVATQLPEAARPAHAQADGVVDVKSTRNSPLLDGTTNGDRPRSYAQTFTGVRQDSGSPLEFVKLMKHFYESKGITEKKTIVFSDSLNVERCFEYKEAAENAGFLPTFGIGTFLTSEY
jgi:nicotinate phosphoribosyltransferase